jgi:GNAT superfamily N-acetyltransferase
VTTLDRARRVWSTLAGPGAAFPVNGVTVVVAPHSRLCPPGWCGVVSLGAAAIVTVPTPTLQPVVESALHHLPATDLTDARQVRAALPETTTFLGPAALAYLHPPDFTPPGTPATTKVGPGDPAVAALLVSVPPGDAAESGLDEITSPAFVTHHDDTVTAAAGYRIWPTGVAHLSVLTAPAHRGRGLAGAVAAHAVADALAAGLLPQWRARPLASRRVARALGFHELGSQLSFELLATPA